MKYKVLDQELVGTYNMHGSQHAVRYRFKLMDEEKNTLTKVIEREEYKGASIENCIGKVIEEDEYGFEVINTPMIYKEKPLYKETGNKFIYTSGLEI